jgi:hypothetical protein
VAWACLLLLPVGLGGGPWWEPASYAGMAALVLAYLCWRLRIVFAPFFPDWQHGAAEIAGWPPRLLATVHTVLWAVAFAAVVASWLR